MNVLLRKRSMLGMLCSLLIASTVLAIGPSKPAYASQVIAGDMEDVADWTSNHSNGFVSQDKQSDNVMQGQSSMHFRVTNNTDGLHDYIKAVKNYTGSYLNLNSQDLMSFWIKTDTYTPYFRVVLVDSDGTWNDVDLADVITNTTSPTEFNPEKWFQVDWSYKSYPGWVSGGDGVMNYSAIKSIEFYVDDETMKSDQVSYWIDDIRFMTKADKAPYLLVDDMDGITDWSTSDSATAISLSTIEVKQGTSSMKFTTQNNNDATHDYRKVYKNGAFNLADKSVMTFWFKSSVDLDYFEVRLHSGNGTEADAGIKELFPLTTQIKAGVWYKARWNYKADPGWVHHGTGVMNYSDITQVMFYVDDFSLPASSEVSLYIDDVNFISDPSRMMLDPMANVARWDVPSGATIEVTNSTDNVRDGSTAIALSLPNNNDGLSNYPTAKNNFTTPININSFDHLTMWLKVSDPTIALSLRIEDGDGTLADINLNEIYWGPILSPGTWTFVEWPFKEITGWVRGGNGTIDYSNIIAFSFLVDDNTLIKGKPTVTYYLDSLEALTARELTRIRPEFPALAPSSFTSSNDRFRLGMYTDPVVGVERMFPDMKKHGVDFVTTSFDRFGGYVMQNSDLARKLDLDIVRNHYPGDLSNSLDSAVIDSMAQADSDQASLSDPTGDVIEYLTSNELELYWPYNKQPTTENGFQYLNDRLRYWDSTHQVSRVINSHHYDYIWQKPSSSLPWYMERYILGNYGGDYWMKRNRETAQRNGANNIFETLAWLPSSTLTNVNDRRYYRVDNAPLNLDAMADFKDNMWTAFDGGASGVAYYIWDGAGVGGLPYQFVDHDGNDVNDRRWVAYSDIAKQIRATEGIPFVELTYPRRTEVIRKGTVVVEANAVKADAPIQSVMFEFNDGTNDTWTTIGTATTQPYKMNWDTTTLSENKTYYVRTRAFDGTDYSNYDTSDKITLMTTNGPELSDVTVNANPTMSNNDLTILATATDASDNISRVEYFIDTVQRAGNGIPMNAIDGSFDSLSESISGTITIPSYSSTEPIQIDDMENISEWTGSGGALLSLYQDPEIVTPGSHVMKMAISNNNNGVHDQLVATKEYATPLDLTHLDTMSFWVRSDVDLSQLQVSLVDQDHTRLDSDISDYLGTAQIGKDRWVNVRWNFKENPASIAGGDGYFDDSKVKIIAFNVDDETLPTSGQQTLFIDEVRMFAETRWSEGTTPIVYVRAQNSAGHWGPSISVKVNLTNNSVVDTLGPVTVVAGMASGGITDGLNTVWLTANIDDGINGSGSSKIVEAEYFVGSVGADGSGTKMLPVDGNWDSLSESVIASVNTSGWSSDKEYSIFIHGKDAAGNWGAFYTKTIVNTEIKGPMIQNVSSTPSPTAGASTITIHAVADETDTGRGKIVAAEYFVGSMGYEGNGIAMIASDGAFSGIVEQIKATINVSGWSAGEHIIYVHAQDSRGKWGPTKAVTMIIS